MGEFIEKQINQTITGKFKGIGLMLEVTLLEVTVVIVEPF
jgi:hypothetical protein